RVDVHRDAIFFHVVKSEGPRSLYLGLTPAFMRLVLYGSLRLGLYEPSKYVCGMAFESSNVLVKIASGAFSGAIATALTNPMEVLKLCRFKAFSERFRTCHTSCFSFSQIRLQMNPNLRRGAIRELRKIASEEGISALWKGVGPEMARAAALTASQLATCDESKRVKF
ncbi:uncharacterized protein LOC130751562, partial [Actinidia eriantha]|uniref:uncharacterized protein LOC130751562 n=1 Tax=Actinidia eriantha TaxID=165200 RepID=UPI00258D38FE